MESIVCTVICSKIDIENNDIIEISETYCRQSIGIDNRNIWAHCGEKEFMQDRNERGDIMEL